MKTKQANKISTGKYVPFDFKTYQKIKKIKAVMNLSAIGGARFDKWGAKRSYNRKRKAPKFCNIFYYIFSVESNDSKRGKYDVQLLLSYSELSEYSTLTKYIEKLWEYATTQYDSPEDIPDFNMNPTWKLIRSGRYVWVNDTFYNMKDRKDKPSVKIDDLYRVCSEWHKKNVNKNGAVK